MSDSLLQAPWTAAHQAPLSMGFSRLEYWSGLPCPLPGDLPNPCLLCILHWQLGSLPLALPGKLWDTEQIKAKARNGLRVQNWCRDSLKTLALNRISILIWGPTLRCSRSPDDHHVSYRGNLLWNQRNPLFAWAPPRCQEDSSNVFNMVSHFSKMHITLPLMLGGPEVGVGTSEQQGLLPWGPHIREPHGASSCCTIPSRWEVCSVWGYAHGEFIPSHFAHTLSTQGYKIACPYGPEPAPRVYMGLSSESRLPRLECTPLGIGMHTPRPKREPRHSSLLGL